MSGIHIKCVKNGSEDLNFMNGYLGFNPLLPLF